jgi:hypothetical protein
MQIASHRGNSIPASSTTTATPRALPIWDDAEQPYRARLTAMIDALVAGLGRDAKGWRIAASPVNAAMLGPRGFGGSTLKREVYCVNRKATASIAIKPAINNNEIVAAILFALGLSFDDRRP